MTHRFLISQDAVFSQSHSSPITDYQYFAQTNCASLCAAPLTKHASQQAFFYLLMWSCLITLHLLTNRPSTNSDLRVIKGLTARRVIDYLKEHDDRSSLKKLEHQQRDRKYKYSLWPTEKNVFPVISERTFMQKLNYIHTNPVRAGLAERATDYSWSSARIWAGCPIENEPLLVNKDMIHWRRSWR